MLACLSGISTAVAGFGPATSVQAAVIPSVDFTWRNATQDTTVFSSLVRRASDFDANNSLVRRSGTGTLRCEIGIHSCSVTQNPSVALSIAVKNQLPLTQSFTFTVTFPVVRPITPSLLVGGWVGGCVTDEHFSDTLTPRRI